MKADQEESTIELERSGRLLKERLERIRSQTRARLLASSEMTPAYSANYNQQKAWLDRASSRGHSAVVVNMQ